MLSREIGSYVIQDPLGKGGQATVYRAAHKSLGRQVALKILRPELARYPVIRERFHREMKTLASLSHPHILTIHDAGEAGDILWYAMELMSDATLLDAMVDHGYPTAVFPMAHTVELLSGVLDALSLCHDRGIVHRDLKPSNIFVSPARGAVLGDFGLIHLSDMKGLTTPGDFLGTELYASPEQLLGDTIDARSDIYQVGLILYELAVGELPYANSAPAIVEAKCDFSLLRRPREANPSIPEPVEALILAATTRDKTRRLATATQFLAELRKLGEMTLPQPLTWRGRAAHLAVDDLRSVAASDSAADSTGGVDDSTADVLDALETRAPTTAPALESPSTEPTVPSPSTAPTPGDASGAAAQSAPNAGTRAVAASAQRARAPASSPAAPGAGAEALAGTRASHARSGPESSPGATRAAGTGEAAGGREDPTLDAGPGARAASAPELAVVDAAGRRLTIPLSAKIFLLLGAIILALAGSTFALVSQKVAGQVFDAEGRALAATRRVVGEFLRRHFELLEGQAVLIADVPKFVALLETDDAPTCAQDCHHYQEISRADLFLVTDPAGKVLASLGSCERPIRAASEVDLLARARPDRPVTGLLIRDKGLYLVVTVPVRDPDHLVGYLTNGFRVDREFAQLVKSVASSDVAFTLDGKPIISTLPAAVAGDLGSALMRSIADHTIIPQGPPRPPTLADATPANAEHTPAEAPTTVGTGPSRTPAIARAMAGQAAGVAAAETGSGGDAAQSPVPLTLAGGDYLSLWAPLVNAPGAERAQAVLLRDLAPAHAFVTAIERALAILGTMAVLIALLLSYLATRRVTRSLRDLVFAVSRMEVGDYAAPIDSGDRDEIGYLAGAFRQMREGIRAQMETLKAANQNLQFKVEEIVCREVLGRDYSEIKTLGRGSMGIVCRAHNVDLDRDVAIKILSPTHAEDTAVVNRFYREARIQARLKHPNILAVYQIRRGQLPFVEMELFTSEDLKALIDRKGPLGLELTVSLALQLLDAVAYLHASGVVHRDIKPENVLVAEERRVKLADYGTALDATSTRLTTGSEVMGTLAFMAPEQLAGRTVDRRADIYAIGVTLYTMLTGQLPFAGTGLVKRLDMVDRWPSERVPGLPVRIDAVVRRCMADDPARRYENAGQLRADLVPLGPGPGPEAS